MTPEQLEAQSRAAIKVWCDDPSVQLEYCHKEKETWHTKDSCPAFDLSAYYYRIAKPRKWYRVALYESGRLGIAESEREEKAIQGFDGFVRWLDERKYYD